MGGRPDASPPELNQKRTATLSDRRDRITRMVSGISVMSASAETGKSNTRRRVGPPLTFSVPDDGWYEEVSGLVAMSSGVRVILTQFDREGSTRGYQFLDVASDLKSQSTRRPASWREVGATRRGVVCVVNDPVPTLSVFEGARCP
jgi:hypothetical protein